VWVAQGPTRFSATGEPKTSLGDTRPSSGSEIGGDDTWATDRFALIRSRSRMTLASEPSVSLVSRIIYSRSQPTLLPAGVGRMPIHCGGVKCVIEDSRQKPTP
jgi:hypothetical protein